MTRIRFTHDPVLAPDLRHLGYEKGTEVDLESASANRWVNRGVAVVIPDARPSHLLAETVEQAGGKAEAVEQSEDKAETVEQSEDKAETVEQAEDDADTEEQLEADTPAVSVTRVPPAAPRVRSVPRGKT
jgi:hypothetical protein